MSDPISVNTTQWMGLICVTNLGFQPLLFYPFEIITMLFEKTKRELEDECFILLECLSFSMF